MRYKYETRGIVLRRSPLGEANVFVVLLTHDLGLVRARVQGLRLSGAKLASSLKTFAESEVVLVRGKEGWRIAGAVLKEDWFALLRSQEARSRAARVSDLLMRLVAGEANDSVLFPVIKGFFNALSKTEDDLQEAAEMLAAIRILSVLGFDEENVQEEASVFTEQLLSEVIRDRTRYIARINNSINTSGL
ncbi:MAG: recombination protein O N-terminal domain-containing protein [bacterium]|nr:recombination protein O N-terminal domain-containing protein [bacterium]